MSTRNCPCSTCGFTSRITVYKYIVGFIKNIRRYRNGGGGCTVYHGVYHPPLGRFYTLDISTVGKGSVS